MKILFVAAECTPVVKAGGLADVVGALPKALRDAGHDARVIIPKYISIDPVRFPSTPRWLNLSVAWPAKPQVVHIEEGRLPGGVPLYFMDCPAMFHPQPSPHSLEAIYANSGDPELLKQEMQRFLFFSLAVTSTLRFWDWQPDVIHLHDWHTASVATMSRLLPSVRRTFPPTLLTIHNLQNQGRWNPTEVFDWLGWSGKEDPLLEKRDGLGNLNLLQVGIAAVNAVNTVSPTYAQEILTTEFGDGLEDDLAKRLGGVAGILNGIDTQAFNPATDPVLASRYDAQTVAIGKSDNRAVLADHLNWTIPPGVPLIVSVGRLTAQKGYQLLRPIAADLFREKFQLVVLGTGTPDVEAELKTLADEFPAFKLVIGFDAKLAQLLYAAGDAFLMPSQFEPCGLGQMIAMRYGTLPIVRATGGLRDTVRDIDQDPGAGTGFVFDRFTPAALLTAIQRALRLLDQPDKLAQARQRAMRQDFSWGASSRDYVRLYEKITAKKSA